MTSSEELPLDPDLPIIDTHHHLWEQAPLEGYTPYTIDQFADEILQSGHNVVANVYNDSLVGTGRRDRSICASSAKWSP
jgi:hypothetical protein